MAKIDWDKEVLPQMRQIDDTEGIETVQQLLFEATKEQLKKLQKELDALQERIANKITASIWN